jgi:hypothetical protein
MLYEIKAPALTCRTIPAERILIDLRYGIEPTCMIKKSPGKTDAHGMKL